MTTAGYIMVAAVICLAVAVVLWDRRRLRRTMRQLDGMLDAAIRDGFHETVFDESLRSAVETKLADYLSASAVSARKVRREKENIEALISDISHQTKTPLSNILLYTQLLSEQVLPEPGRDLAAALEDQAEKLRRLIDSLVKLSRLESGILTFHPRNEALAPMLEEAVAQLRPRAEKKKIELVFHPTDSDAVFDRKWTEEAVCNLLDNAVKYVPAGGRVTVRAVAYELFCRIDVTDNGPGVPEEEQAEIFGRFYRGQGHPAEEGVGVGLYLVRQIAEGQGGYVKVFSKPGKGAKFSLFLPRSCGEFFQNR